MKSPNAKLWILTAILVVALGLRLWGSTFGIPREYAADEWKKVVDAYHYRESGFRHVKYQPSFLYHTLYALFAVTDPIKPFFEKCAPSRLPAPPQYAHLGHLLWVGRIWMALLSTATVFAVFLLGRRLKDETAGLAAAALYAVCSLPVFAAHYIKEDTPLALMATIAIILAIRLQENGRWRDYIYAGLGCALAFSAKFPGAATLVLAMIAAWLAPSHSLALVSSEKAPPPPDATPAKPPMSGWLKKAMGTGLIVVCFLAGFAILCPVFAYHLKDSWEGIAFQTRYVLTGHFDSIAISPLEESFSFHLLKSLVPGMTIFPLLAALAGLLLLMREKPRAAVLMAVWTIGYYLMIESAKAKPYPFFARYILPVVPALCALAGIAVARLIAWLFDLLKASQAGLAAQRQIMATRFRLTPAPETAAQASQLDRQFRQFGAAQRMNMRWRLAVMLVLAAIFFPPFYQTSQRVAAINPDTRDTAQEWMMKNMPRGAILLWTPYGPYADEKEYRVIPFSPANFRKYCAENSAARASAPAADNKTSGSVYCILSSIFYQRYLDNPTKVPEMTVTFSEIIKCEKPVARFTSPVGAYGFNNPDVLIYRY